MVKLRNGNDHMPQEKAKEFVTYINLFEPGMVACINVTLPDKSTKWAIPTAGRIATNVFWDDKLHRWNMRGAAFYNIVQQREYWLMRYNLPQDFPLVEVCVIDTKWGRVASSKKGLYGAILRAKTSSTDICNYELHPEWALGF